MSDPMSLKKDAKAKVRMVFLVSPSGGAPASRLCSMGELFFQVRVDLVVDVSCGDVASSRADADGNGAVGPGEVFHGDLHLFLVDNGVDRALLDLAILLDVRCLQLLQGLVGGFPYLIHGSLVTRLETPVMVDKLPRLVTHDRVPGNDCAAGEGG